ncbi:MAG: cation transporter [Treponema sp.]|nr:cation transporter [Treponema sp.]
MEKTINVKGMMCSHCEAHVKKALEAVAGVTEAVASHEKGTAVVTLSQDVADDVLTAAVKEAGYEVLGVN